MRKRTLPIPTDFTLADRLHIALSVLILAVGFAILWRMLPLGLNVQAVVVSLAFVGFGVYRLWLAITRLREWEISLNEHRSATTGESRGKK